MSGRYFLRDVPYAEALEAWERARREESCPHELEAVDVGLDESHGRVTAAPVWAARSSPSFDAAAMDGVAVRAQDTIGASDVTPLHLSPDQFVVVDTGDPLPPEFDAVVMREHLHWHGDEVELRAAASPFEHVRPIGEDIAATELLLPGGHRLRAVDLGAMAAAGISEVTVRRQPIVAVLPTGDELVPAGVEPASDQLLDTNSPMLAARATETGCEVIRLPICPDDPDRLAEQVRAAALLADLVLVVAGSSAGRDDHTASIVERCGRLAVHGVALKPGHPVVLGVVDRTPLIGVPGYPVSAALTFDLFAAPLLAELEGVSRQSPARVRARLARKLASMMGMDDWIRVRLGRVAGTLVAAPLPRGAGVLTSLVRADGLLLVPAEVEGYHAGDEVEVELRRSLDDVDRTLVVVGSHDPVLDLAASRIRTADPTRTLAAAAVGSLGGLIALRDGLCHVAGSHLLEPTSGKYTLPYVDEILPDRDVAVIRLVRRSQGLLVAPGNPLQLSGIEDVGERAARYVNRQRGSGTRVLLDHLLAQLDIESRAIDGYGREAFTHLAVAAAVAAGRADCGLGVKAAAQAFGLDFVPVADEPFDLVLEAATLEDKTTAPLLALLDDTSFHGEIEALGGYDTSETGRRVR